MKFWVAARDQSSAENFRARNGHLHDVNIVFTDSLFQVLDEITASGEVACFLHDDVTVPHNFEEKLSSFLIEAEVSWPSWGIAGNAGVLSLRLNGNQGSFVRFLSDPLGGPNFGGFDLPVQSVDGNTILLNAPKLKALGLSLPNFRGFQLYDLILSLEVLSLGLSVIASPKLAVYHDSPGSQSSFDEAVKSVGFQRYLYSKVKQSVIATLNGNISPEIFEDVQRGDLDVVRSSLENASKGRPPKSLAIITRSMPGRQAVRKRCSDSIDYLVEMGSLSSSLAIRHIISGTKKFDEADENTSEYREFLHIEKAVPEGVDTRSLLLVAAVQDVDADFYWFVDDDDWIFPSNFDLLGLALLCFPSNAVFAANSQQFYESIEPSEYGRNDPASIFEARHLSKVSGGYNPVPFCSVIYPKHALVDIGLAIDSLTRYEDLALLAEALLRLRLPFFTLDRLIACVSVRPEDRSQTVIEPNRDEWNRNVADLTSAWTVSDEFGWGRYLTGSLDYEDNDSSERMLALNRYYLNQRDEAIRQLEEIARSMSWRMTRPLRILKPVIRRLSHFRRSRTSEGR